MAGLTSGRDPVTGTSVNLKNPVGTAKKFIGAVMGMTFVLIAFAVAQGQAVPFVSSLLNRFTGGRVNAGGSNFEGF